MSTAPEISPRLYRAGHGEPLVLVHGFTATWRCWHPVLADLVPRFEVIAPTLHGHAGGPPPPDHPAHTIGEGADHLEKLLDELGVGEAHFAGNSMGGALSLEMAKRGRARSVVAISPGGGWEEHDTAEPQRIIRWFARNQRLARATAPRMRGLVRRPGTRKLIFRDVMTRGDMLTPAEALDLVESSINCAVVDDVFATIRSGNALVRDLDQISIPVLLAWGERDRILPLDRHSARFRREIPGVQFRALRGVGHTPMWDDAAGIAKLIADFAAAASRAPVAA